MRSGVMSAMPAEAQSQPSAASPTCDARRERYDAWMARAAGFANDDLFARMLASQGQGENALPPGLGLVEADFLALMARHFPAVGATLAGLDSRVDAAREAERDDLSALLLAHRAGRDDSERWMAEIVACACMGADHLWQDLGLWSRVDLSRLMTHNFPALAAKNSRDMKWKKFLYKQLCDRAEVQVCRSPSCAVCADYGGCFGPED
jgi:nitrogen fixation protein NifQ